MSKRPIRHLLKSCSLYLAAGSLALLATEVFLNLVLSPTIEKCLWFTGSIHRPNETYGFVFTPNYRGWMRHRDGVYLERLTLEEHGFRVPVRHAHSKQNVVLIGGYSIVFSYGLPDNESLPAVICDQLRTPSTVYSVAWPGFDSFRSFHVYRKLVSPKVHPDFVVVSFYRDKASWYAKLPEELDHFYDPDPPADLFRYYPDHVVARPNRKLALVLGRLYYRSLLAHNGADALDSLIQSTSLGWTKTRNFLGRVRRIVLPRVALRLPWGNPVTADVTTDEDSSRLGEDQFECWTAYLQSCFGTDRVLFLFLPCLNSDSFYDPLIARLPQNAHFLNLQPLRDKVWGLGMIADNHYSSAACRLVGEALAREIDRIQSQPTTPSAPDSVPNQ